MVSTFSPNLNLEIPARGDYPNAWDNPADANYGLIDQAYGAVTTLTLSSGVVALTPAQAANQGFQLTGSLAGDVYIYFPAGKGGGRKFIVPSCTMNGHTIYVRGNGGTDTNGIFFQVQFGIPYDILVTPWRVYWDYGASPPGTIADFATSFAHPGWLPCDGRGVSTTLCDLLYDVIGFSYGGSGGIFNVPDYRGRVTAMADNIGTGSAGRLNGWGINVGSGAASHVITTAEMPSHNHTAGDSGHGHGVTENPHTHGGVLRSTGLTTGAAVGGGNSGSVGSTDGNTTNLTVNTGYANIVVNYTGGSNAMSLLQPLLTTMKCIRW